MSKPRLGKRERQLLQLAKAQGQRQQPKRFDAVNVPNWARSPNGSVNSVSALKAGTHSNFRGQGASYGVKVISHGATHLGRIEKGSGWRSLAPLPDLTHEQLRALERGHKVMPVEREPTVNTRPTAPVEKRFGKTK